MKKFVISLVVLAGLGYAGYRGYHSWQAKQHAEAKAKQPKTQVASIRDIQFNINVAGDIGPADQVSVRPEVNGKILTLPVDLGDDVKKGQVLFTLDDTDLQIERSTRQTEIEGAKLQLEKAKRNYERSKELFQNKLISQELFEDTKTAYELALNSLERAESSLRLVEDKLTKTKIVAPFDCTVLTRPVSVGQAVSGSGGFNSGTEVLTIANLNEMVVNAHINQADVTRLSVNQEVTIQIDSVPGLKLKGVVDRVAPQATVKNGIKGYAARINLKQLDNRVRPGMTANITIPVATAENVVAVPLSAIFTEQDGRYVYIRNSSGFERRPVQIGVADYFYAEVQKGINEGEVIALELPEGAADQKKERGPGGKSSDSKRALSLVTPGGPSKESAPAKAAPTKPATTATSRSNS